MELWVGCWMVAYLWILFIVLTSSVKSETGVTSLWGYLNKVAIAVKLLMLSNKPVSTFPMPIYITEYTPIAMLYRKVENAPYKVSSMFAPTSLRSQGVAIITAGGLLGIHTSHSSNLLVTVVTYNPYKARFEVWFDTGSMAVLASGLVLLVSVKLPLHCYM